MSFYASFIVYKFCADIFHFNLGLILYFVQVGRVKNAHCVMMNARLLTVMATDTALAVNVNVFEATRELCAKKVRLVTALPLNLCSFESVAPYRCCINLRFRTYLVKPHIFNVLLNLFHDFLASLSFCSNRSIDQLIVPIQHARVMDIVLKEHVFARKVRITQMVC